MEGAAAEEAEKGEAQAVGLLHGLARQALLLLPLLWVPPLTPLPLLPPLLLLPMRALVIFRRASRRRSLLLCLTSGDMQLCAFCTGAAEGVLACAWGTSPNMGPGMGCAWAAAPAAPSAAAAAASGATVCEPMDRRALLKSSQGGSRPLADAASRVGAGVAGGGGDCRSGAAAWAEGQAGAGEVAPLAAARGLSSVPRTLSAAGARGKCTRWKQGCMNSGPIKTTLVEGPPWPPPAPSPPIAALPPSPSWCAATSSSESGSSRSSAAGEEAREDARGSACSLPVLPISTKPCSEPCSLELSMVLRYRKYIWRLERPGQSKGLNPESGNLIAALHVRYPGRGMPMHTSCMFIQSSLCLPQSPAPCTCTAGHSACVGHAQCAYLAWPAATTKLIRRGHTQTHTAGLYPQGLKP